VRLAISESRERTLNLHEPQPGARSHPSNPPEPAEAARLAAQWVAQQLDDIGTTDLSCLVIDAEGSICGWLTSPRTDPAVLSALVLQAEFNSASPDEGVPQSAGTNAAGLLSGAGLTGLSIGMGGERSMEALTLAEPPQHTSLLARGHRNDKRDGKRNGKPNTNGKPNPSSTDRHAVLSIADAAPRVFLNELDSLGISPRHVRGLWHALAAAWDPSSKHDADRPRPTTTDNTLDATNTPITATIILDPRGRLHWAWSAQGALLAANTFRIPRAHLHDNLHEKTATPSVPDSDRTSGAALIVADAGDDSSTAAPQVRPHLADNPILCTKAHASRLVADWIAWSLQLGISPSQIVALGPEHALRLSQLSTTSEPSQNGAATLGQLLAERWPSATVSAIADEDPIGSTIRRLTVTRGGSTAKRAAANDQPARPVDDIVPLVERPTRVHRNAYRALAACLIALSILLVFLGYRLRAAGEDARQQATALRSQRTELLRKYEPIIPRLRESLTPVDLIARATRDTAQQAADLTESKPIFSETVLVLRAVMDVFIEQGLLDRAYDPRDLDAHLAEADPFLNPDDNDGFYDDENPDDLIPPPPAPPTGRIVRISIADVRAPSIVIEIPSEAANRVAPALRDRLTARGSRIDWNYRLDAATTRGTTARTSGDMRTVTFNGFWKRPDDTATAATAPTTGSTTR